jgi:hypothetical protein
LSSGAQKFSWQPENLPEGIYLCRVKTNQNSEVMKMIYNP